MSVATVTNRFSRSSILGLLCSFSKKPNSFSPFTTPPEKVKSISPKTSLVVRVRTQSPNSFSAPLT